MAGKKQEKKENYTRERRPVTMPAGRPFGTMKYDTVEDLDKGIEEYFRECDKKGKPYTLEGLAYSLNIDPRTLNNYGNEGYGEGKFFPSVYRARCRCLAYKAERLYDKDGVQGAKFDLVNNSERMGGLRYADRDTLTRWSKRLILPRSHSWMICNSGFPPLPRVNEYPLNSAQKDENAVL
jgi:hypothetical protein